MKAAQVTNPGVVEVVEVTDPVAGPGEVLVRIGTSTINPVDAFVASGALGTGTGLGWDVVGTVEGLGDGVTGFALGDRVAGVRVDITGPVRGIAELNALPASDLAVVPDGLDDARVAAVGMNALTALQALRMLGDPAERTLLVTGAAGAVGGLALEIARDLGWVVTGLAREGDREFVEATGAKLVTALEGTYDAVFDPAVLGEALARQVSDGGSYVGVQPSAPQPVIPGATVDAVSVQPDGAALTDLLGRAVAGSLNTRVAGSFALADVQEALAAVGTPGSRGRWVVTLR